MIKSGFLPVLEILGKEKWEIAPSQVGPVSNLYFIPVFFPLHVIF